MEMNEKSYEQALWRRAKRLGLLLQKSRSQFRTLDNYGLYRLLNPNYNLVVVGEKLDLTLEDVEAFLDQYKKGMSASR
jgi:hypothetical protein